MDVAAHAGAVGGGVVGAEDRQGAVARGGADGQGIRCVSGRWSSPEPSGIFPAALK